MLLWIFTLGGRAVMRVASATRAFQTVISAKTCKKRQTPPKMGRPFDFGNSWCNQAITLRTPRNPLLGPQFGEILDFSPTLVCRPASGNFRKGLSQDDSVLPTNLRWFVDEADGCAHDDPLNEVGDGLVDGQRKADIQVDVVVDRKR